MRRTELIACIEAVVAARSQAASGNVTAPGPCRTTWFSIAAAEDELPAETEGAILRGAPTEQITGTHAAAASTLQHFADVSAHKCVSGAGRATKRMRINAEALLNCIIARNVVPAGTAVSTLHHRVQ